MQTWIHGSQLASGNIEYLQQRIMKSANWTASHPETPPYHSLLVFVCWQNQLDAALAVSNFLWETVVPHFNGIKCNFRGWLAPCSPFNPGKLWLVLSTLSWFDISFGSGHRLFYLNIWFCHPYPSLTSVFLRQCLRQPAKSFVNSY